MFVLTQVGMEKIRILTKASNRGVRLEMQAREKRQGRERRTWTEIRFKVKAKDWL